MLVDTEGLYDKNNSTMQNATIFALSTLLSSIQVFNLDKNFQENALESLQVKLQLRQNIISSLFYFEYFFTCIVGRSLQNLEAWWETCVAVRKMAKAQLFNVLFSLSGIGNTKMSTIMVNEEAKRTWIPILMSLIMEGK